MRVHFNRHRDIVSLSFSRPTFYHVSATSHFQSAGPRSVSQLDSAQAPDALTSGPTATVSSSGPILPASYLVRDPEQIAASKALLVLHEGPRTFEFSLLAENISETQDIPQTSDVPQPSEVSQDFEVINHHSL